MTDRELAVDFPCGFEPMELEPTSLVATVVFPDATADDFATVGIEAVIALVCKELGLLREDLLTKRRFKHLVRARWIAQYVARQVCGASYSALGRAFGGQDHTTVMHGVRAVEEACKVSDRNRLVIDSLIQKAQGRL